MLTPALVLAQQKNKKHSGVSAVFMNARYVYVESPEGDITRPELYPEDRQAISDVENGVQNWNRYAVTIGREQADLVFVVRKGRTLGEQNRVGISAGPRPQGPPTQNRQPGQVQDPDGIGVASEVGPSDDLLQVFTTNPDGKLIGPIWMQEMKDGLDGPSVPLLWQLRSAVERAYPSQPPAKKP
jgi:hypothetical protein